MSSATVRLSRRRMITVLAAAAGMPLSARAGTAGRPQGWVWQGTALGAPAKLIFVHPDGGVAEAALAASLAEIERLENEFSLYRPASALCRLNAEGVLAQPSLDMLALAETAQAISEASGGAFDATVQPLWRLYAGHFAEAALAGDGPSAEAIAAALAHVDYRRLSVQPRRIALPEGMSVTMNGIAQGYITDRVADLLRDRGWTDVMIDLGEIRALGVRSSGDAWTVRPQSPPGSPDPLPVLRLRNRAVATSAAGGTMFDLSGRHHHLFDPRTGRSSSGCIQVTVVADRATTADGLSTALFAARPEERRTILRRFPGSECLIVETDGRLTHLRV